MSAASGTGSLPLGFSDLYILCLHNVVSKCDSELNTLSVSHQAALKERALMEDNLLQAESALALANEKLVQLEGDVVALRKIVIDQDDQLLSVSRKTGVLGTKCDCLESSASDLSSKQLSAGSDLAEVQARVSLLEKAAVETVRQCHQSADLVDIEEPCSRTDTCGEIAWKDPSSPKEACPRQSLEEPSSTQDAVASGCNETLERSSIRNNDRFRILSRLTPCSGCDPSDFLDWLAKIERVALAANCSENVKCWLVAHLVEGKLAHAYDALSSSSKNSLEKMKQSLVAKHVPPSYFERMRCELSLVKQREDENLDAYVNRFCGKAHIAYSGVKSKFVEAQLVWQFINGLSCENLRLKALEQRCPTLTDVVDYVLEFETLQKLAKKSEPQQRLRSKPIQVHWFNRCFKCGVIGHCRRNCHINSALESRRFDGRGW